MRTRDRAFIGAEVSKETKRMLQELSAILSVSESTLLREVLDHHLTIIKRVMERETPLKATNEVEE